MTDVVAFGELLIDFTPQERAMDGYNLFQQNPGGAPANVLAALAKLGKKTAFIGKVGQDAFGVYLQKELNAQQIDTTGLILSDEVNTTLAFVLLSKSGERSFTFHRKPGADQMMNADEIDYSIIANAKIFHFGSVSLTHDPARTATCEAVSFAKKSGSLISYDPNLRIDLWKDAEEAKEIILGMMSYADIVKISEEELEFLTGTTVLETGTEQLLTSYGNALILVTLGHKGCYYRRGEMTGYIQGFRVRTLDTTGAGDAFLGGIHYQILQIDKPLQELGAIDIKNMITFSNAIGALVTTKNGAIPAMPILTEIHELMNFE
ncbi:carbohydrate kinase [Paenibacillus frigoriresistens]|uniref:carbohydrate kinase family protein n=1 Tax=Paenibacillus alginolyticus TaxID=59839 RepID=UPI001566C57E|nr:carbohydrate kinase [Paenibacillus frigoriresistens]NRF93794.1 carbohydrate kinase [Paenibacillus frigoriresistens]